MPDQGEGRCVPCCRLQCMAVWPGPGGEAWGAGPAALRNLAHVPPHSGRARARRWVDVKFACGLTIPSEWESSRSTVAAVQTGVHWHVGAAFGSSLSPRTRPLHQHAAYPPFACGGC